MADLMANVSNRQSKKRRVFERDGHRCVYCGAHEELTLDHIVPWATSRDSSVANLQTLCEHCNQAKWDLCATPETTLRWVAA